MKINQAYWLFQIVGWSIFVFSDLFNYYFIFNFNYNEFENLLTNTFLNISLGVLLTHIFRIFFKNNNWIRLSIPQMILRSAFGAIIITLLLAAVNISMEDKVMDFSNTNWILTDINYVFTIGKPVLMWILIYIFYAYSIERQNDNIEKIKMQANIEASEAKILRAQINPHFMFNALNSIRALIIENPKKAQTSVTQLSNILRSSLVADRKTMVTLKEELKTIEDYLALEKVRYEERLQISWEISDETLNIQIPPMMLQTLVENAIKHGVQKAIGWGYIAIKTNIANDFLVIEIRNTGSLKSAENKNIDGGFGIENTSKRLKLLYGNKANFSIKEIDKNVVSATLNIPIS